MKICSVIFFWISTTPVDIWCNTIQDTSPMGGRSSWRMGINFVRKTEKAIHNTLIEYDRTLWAGERAREWFGNLDAIMNVILTLRDDYIVDMPVHINVSNWKLLVDKRLGRIKKGIRTSEREKQILKGVSTNSLTDVKVLTQKEKSKRLSKNPTQVDTFKPGKK